MRNKFCYKPPRLWQFCDSSLNRLRPEVFSGLLLDHFQPHPQLSSLALKPFGCFPLGCLLPCPSSHIHFPSLSVWLQIPLSHITPVKLPDGCFNLMGYFFKSFLIPMSKLLNVEAENGVIIFNSGLLCHSGKNSTPKLW